jgi:hypothetical protein
MKTNTTIEPKGQSKALRCDALVRRLEIDRFGKWYRGRIALTRGLWRLGLTQDFGSCQIGVSFWMRAGQLTLLFWSIDLAKLTPVEMGCFENMGLVA